MAYYIVAAQELWRKGVHHQLLSAHMFLFLPISSIFSITLAPETKMSIYVYSYLLSNSRMQQTNNSDSSINSPEKCFMLIKKLFYSISVFTQFIRRWMDRHAVIQICTHHCEEVITSRKLYIYSGTQGITLLFCKGFLFLHHRG